VTYTILYTLLQCSEDFKYGCKAYAIYFEVFHMLLAEDDESSPPISRNFQSAATSRHESDKSCQINRICGKTGALPLVELRLISPGATQSKAAEDLEDWNII
jgi:hypothetical protein